ncbi:uncharacterized protein LY89DRAFT_668212 [Mollisia scopiformis]|uniref:Uncharacterized protein n=1 Tax=Mollisia scopiformis TaxID=149040 RepID=A0A194XCW3_MOLSC|nr:uncharacterized protein LY89DRAFT_668212 [Mollisia scopiformis]KUJ18015.1 hypothetical protein LY89DRAFT_668212 [Mollisia scopiformis]
MKTPGFLRRRRDSQKEPPPYTEDIASKPTRSIKATDSPQWRWTEAQCQEWFAAVFVRFLEKSPEEAARLSRSIKGWGPSIYMEVGIHPIEEYNMQQNQNLAESN